MARPSRRTMTSGEWWAYINGEPPRWVAPVAIGFYLLIITIPVVALVFIFEAAGFLEGTAEAAATLAYIPVLYWTNRPADQAWKRLEWRLRQRRRAAADLPSLDDDPRP